MGTPNEELIQRLMAALQSAGLASLDELSKLSQKTLAGKVKPEDWYSMFENALQKQAVGDVDGN